MKNNFISKTSILVLISMLSACGSDNTKEAKLAISKLLSDPSSAEYREVKAYSEGVVCGEVHSKNKFGGYDDFKKFIFNGPETNDVVFSSNDTWCKLPKERADFFKKYLKNYGKGNHEACVALLAQLPLEILRSEKNEPRKNLIHSEPECAPEKSIKNDAIFKHINENSEMTVDQYRRFDSLN